MLLTNYHTHCHFCDGKGSPEEMLSRAKELGFKAIGFSSHAPLPFENDFTLQPERLEEYVKAICALKAQTDIEVYLGLEIDYLKDSIYPADPRWDELNLDYKIGSVHAIAPPDDRFPMLSVDGPDEELDALINDVYQGNVRQMIEDYYQRIADLCAEGGFDILGHFDLIKKHNLRRPFFDESAPWYKDVAVSTLDEVAKSGVIMEVNFGGMLRGATDDVYPPLWMIKEAFNRGIPMQINADAHAPKHLGVHHEYCRELLVSAGYKTQRVLLGGQWQDISL
ncbi:histidinol-phosphatase [Vibrio sp. JC009]|uniref:histidinol-phosphatase n=1 Tax=Vibrio sp. JC009 TaxID=2912314 RepID=UPI0023B1F20C|nr:histidinol-phosphatase [Vibrio sp. JC009]WED24480.1 histidinol-phosphatase [Vibrio sp. JC009]